ncbi:MAG: hypothetical protein C5B52_18010 [Bacteroidetes bacterium]|nr:MAG: hypothetical protein C5B52_18010 [Bacteroidota bacterium]
MKFQVGDKIILLHSNEEGEIIDIIDNKMVMVNVDGVKFPAYTDQIDFPYFKNFTQKKPDPPKSKKFVDNLKPERQQSKFKLDKGVWLVFFPVFDKDVFDDDVVETLKIYLVNQTSDALKFTYLVNYLGDPEFELKNEIIPHSDFYLHDIAFERLNDGPRFDFEFSLSKPDRKKSDYFETTLKLRARQVFTKIEELKMKQEASFSYLLFEHYPDRPPEESFDLGKLAASGYKVYEAKNFRSSLEPVRTVVDLHIEKLTDSWSRLSNLEMLDLQLKAFEKYYELALLHHQPMLIVVHGVGTGRLRDEIHDILRNKKEVKSFVNQFHPSFGYGSTEIYFQY